MPVADTLYRLQQRDLRRDTLLKRQQSIHAALTEPASVLNARTSAADTRQAVATLQATLRDAELERQALDSKLKSEEKRLYGGKVTNVKEMTGIEHEIESLKRRLSKLDDGMLETMFAIEQGQAAQATAATKLAQLERRWEAHVAGLHEQLAAVEAELATLATEITTLRADVDAPNLAIYDRLRETKNGRAVARIVSSRCEGCQVTLPNIDISRARQPAPLAYCSQCGRILLAG
jgi:predicted  nucleic acid-binding Zn-ribbon protein